MRAGGMAMAKAAGVGGVFLKGARTEGAGARKLSFLFFEVIWGMGLVKDLRVCPSLN
jgi:hypothetical protein